MVDRKNVGGRPVNKKPSDLLKIAERNTAANRLDLTQLHNLLRAYFSGELAKWDNEDKLSTNITQIIRVFFAASSGETLARQATSKTIQEIIAKMDEGKTPVGGANFEGYQEYCLRYVVNMADPMKEPYLYMPPPTPLYIHDAVTWFSKLLHDRVLNR